MERTPGRLSSYLKKPLKEVRFGLSGASYAIAGHKVAVGNGETPTGDQNFDAMVSDWMARLGQVAAPATQQIAETAQPVTQPVVEEIAKQASPVVEASAKKGVRDGISELPLGLYAVGAAVTVGVIVAVTSAVVTRTILKRS